MTSPHQRFLEDCDREIAAQGADVKLNALTRDWFIAANAARYSYHFSHLGRPIIQYPQDMVAMQELVWRVRPDVIVETGIAHGGSLIQSASMLALLDLADAAAEGRAHDPARPRRKVVAVDIDIRAHNRAAIEAHPFSAAITMIEGSSIDDGVVEQVRRHVGDARRVLVSLDSNHTHDHVLRELELYAPMVSPGSYCIVYDTIIEHLPAEMFPDRPWGPGDSPWTAVHAYLATTDAFEIDHAIDHKLLVTVAPNGYLRRVR
jgi:cephalosporin hydroxylase